MSKTKLSKKQVAEAAVRATVQFVEGVMTQATGSNVSLDVSDDVVKELVKKVVGK